MFICDCEHHKVKSSSLRSIVTHYDESIVNLENMIQSLEDEVKTLVNKLIFLGIANCFLVMTILNLAITSN